METTHLEMLRNYPTPPVAMSVERSPVVGFIPPVNGVGFRLATAVTERLAFKSTSRYFLTNSTAEFRLRETMSQ
jgi:hypothetical protein